MWERPDVRIIAKKTLVGFWGKSPKSKPSLERWLTVVSAANWTSMNDVQAAVPNVTVLNGERAKFEIGGGNYRLVVAFNFNARIAFIKFVGTHAAYDKINALTVSSH